MCFSELNNNINNEILQIHRGWIQYHDGYADHEYCILCGVVLSDQEASLLHPGYCLAIDSGIAQLECQKYLRMPDHCPLLHSYLQAFTAVKSL